MIQEREQYKTRSTMGGEKISMGIHRDALTHIMNVLSEGLYSDPIAAVVREYSTNGWDAHVEAGNTDPILVSTPTPLAPYLRIQDFGVGLSGEDIREIYSQYGASTKRGTNDQVGMLGLGCKSAFAYATQFTLASVQDGHRVEVMVSRDNDGTGSMTVVEDQPTAEPNGTTVTIPVRPADAVKFQGAATRLFSFWPEGSVLLDGKAPTRFVGMQITDDLYIHEGGESYVVMGNVPYPQDFEWCNSGLVAFVPIGSVMVPPARDKLMDTPETQATLDEVRKDYEAGIGAALQKAMDAAPSKAEAVTTYSKWAQYIPRGAKITKLAWRGEDFPERFSLGQDALGKDRGFIHSRCSTGYRYSLGSHEWHKDHHVTSFAKTVWVTNFAPTSYTAVHKRKTQAWCDEQGFLNEVEHFIYLSDAMPPRFLAWIDSTRIVDWKETLRGIDLSDGTASTGGYGRATRIPGSYDCHTEAGMQSEVKGAELRRKGVPIIWAHGNKWRWQRHYLDLFYDKFTLVCLPQGRIEKFKRDCPEALHYTTAIEGGRRAFAHTITATQTHALAQPGHERRLLQTLDAKRIDDPRLRLEVERATVDVEKLRKQIGQMPGEIPLPPYPHPFKPYKLVESSTYRYSTYDPEHLTLYVNAAYAASQKESS